MINVSIFNYLILFTINDTYVFKFVVQDGVLSFPLTVTIP